MLYTLLRIQFNNLQLKKQNSAVMNWNKKR